jgi:hypothetical protein
MTDHLIVSLKDYKTEMEYKNVDFNSDVVAMFSTLREDLALAFDCKYFGLVDLPVQDSEELSKKEENAFKAEVATAKSPI